MSWANVRGHEQHVVAFENAWKRGRLGHAYLFVGPPGIGKHTFARELGKTLLCENSHQKFAACGHCDSCLMVDANSHPDFLSASRDEASVTLSVEVIRELTEKLSLKPARGQRKKSPSARSRVAWPS